MEPSTTDDKTSKKPMDLATGIWIVAILAVVMSLYAYLRLTQSETGLKIVAGLVLVIGIAVILADRKQEEPSELIMSFASVVVFASIVLGLNQILGQANYSLIIVAYFFRPEFTRYGNRRLAFVLNLMIVGAVLPVTLGLVTDGGVTTFLTWVALLLVGCLWLFCSKAGAWWTGFGQ